MNRSLFVVTALALPIFGCSGDDTGETSDSSPTTGIASVSVSATNPTSTTMGSMTDATAGSSTTDGETDSGASASSSGMECMTKDDCGKGQKCEDGICVFDPEFCGEAVINVPIATPNMIMVVDKSGSMVANTWDGDNDPNTPEVTRWFSLYNVVEFVASTFNGSINLGLQLFPSLKAKTEYNVNACLVEATPEVPIAPENGAAVLSALPSEGEMVKIAGGTPARLGLEAAVAHIKGLNDGLPKFVLFITDGAANCSPDAATDAERFEVYDAAVFDVISNAFAEGIGVFVVGIDVKNETSAAKADGNPDNTNTFTELNKLAVAGGFPKNDPNEQFYNAVNQIELQAALTNIAQQVLPCIITLDPVPTFPDFVEVTINGVNYKDPLPNKECGADDGWFFSKDDFSEITLCGAACSGYQMSGAIDAQYKCPGSG